MKALLPALLAMFGLGSTPETRPELPPHTRAAEPADRAALAFLPRGTYPRRRSYGLPPGDWSTPYRQILDRADAPHRLLERARKEARRVKAWAATCAARGYA